jgi:lysophospholipase L1-like esterase
VARALGLDLRDVTYSGATTGDILRTSARGQPAQLDAVTPATRLVTLTGGGTDVVGYLPRLTLASLPGPLRILPKVRAQIAGFGDPDATDERFAGVRCNLQAIVHGVRDRAPAARLAATTRAAADAADGEYVAASVASADHHAWSATPWTRRFHLSLRGGAPYHPNAAGMAAVAALVLATLESS